jgi:FkbM family methyltransferase
MTKNADRSALSWEVRWRYSLLKEFYFYFRKCSNWSAVIGARRRNTPLHEFVVRSGQVITFQGPPPFIIFRDIWDQNVYLPAESEMSIPPEDVHAIVDIGAHIGLFSLFASWCFPHATIYAYEPAPANFQVLAENVRRNPAARIKAFPLAVTRERAEAVLHLMQETGCHSLLASADSFNHVPVQTVDLETVIANSGNSRIDFLKMDCEGAEYEILQDKSQLLSDRVRHLAMEYHETDDHKVAELESLLKAADFDWQLYPQPEWRTGILIAQNRKLENGVRS